MKEISRSLQQINGSHSGRRDQKLVRSKRSAKEKLIESQPKEAIRPTLPPITSYNSDSDSGKEVTNSCICEGMYKTSGECHETNQWVVSRPVRNRPKDNLRLEGPMEMETTFKTTYESTAKRIDNLSKNVAVVVPSNKSGLDGRQVEEVATKSTVDGNGIKASKKKAKHRPSTSLKAGGDGYFNTSNKECYKNFVIIDDKSKSAKANGKPSNICCSTVSDIKLPKVDSNNREDKQSTRRMSREEKATQAVEQMNKSMQRLTTSDKYESRNTQTNGCAFVDTSVQTNNNREDNEPSMRSRGEDNHKRSAGANQREASDEEKAGVVSSWTVASLEEPKRVFTRDVDNIKELGLLDEPNERMIREIQGFSESEIKNRSVDQYKYSSTRMRNESSMSKHYVQPQTRLKKHKNESSMKFFDGDMDFMTTTRANFADKSPNRAEPRPQEREKTAGKRSRKSGRKGNLFRTSTEAQFNEPYGQNCVTETTYQKQFADRLYCPAIDLGSDKSQFQYRGEASGHKFFLPAVNN